MVTPTKDDSGRRTITTKAWQEAGQPFELWLRYAGASPEVQQRVEEMFWRQHDEPR